MKLAFILFKYFPYGGLERDCLRIAEEAVKRGHQVCIYTMTWQGDPPPKGIDIEVEQIRAWSNHARISKFYQQIKRKMQQTKVDLMVGFNRMPNLDLYYGADPCYQQKSLENHSWLYRLTARYRLYRDFEAAVYQPSANVELLFIAKEQIQNFIQYYQTPKDRFHLLPPNIAPDRKRPVDAVQKRADYRKKLGFNAKHQVLLMIGSIYKRKGVDRTLYAIAALPESIRKNIRLIVAGEETRLKYYHQLAKKLNIVNNIESMNARQDVPELLLAADLFLHPARHENTGTVILEAVVAGLPQIVSGICGYAFHIKQAAAGIVLNEPFQQTDYNQALLSLLSDPERLKIDQQQALYYAKTEDLYGMPNKAVDVIEETGKNRSQANIYTQDI